MIVTRKRNHISNVTTRKVGALTCLSKDLPINLWCPSCSDSKNLGPRQKKKPCCQPWIFQETNKIHKRKHFEIIDDHFIEQSIELPNKSKNKILVSVSSEDSSDDNYLCKGIMITSRSVLKKYVIDNLRSTALQLENQDSLLETVLSKKVCDIIDKTKVKKLSVNEFAIHSSSCKGKACSVAKCQECYKLNSRIRNKLREKVFEESQTLPNINTRIDIICKNPSVAEKEIKRSRNEAKILRRKLAIENLKRIMDKRAQECSSSVDTKLIHRIFNEANSKVKSVLEEDSNQMGESSS